MSVSVVIAPISRPPLASLIAAQRLDAAQIDDHPRTPDAVLEPVEGVHAAGHQPGVGPVAIEQAEHIVHARRLEELECRDYVVNHTHGSSSP